MAAEITAEKRAQIILAGKAANSEEVLALIRELHQERRFGLARRLLERLQRFSEVAADPTLRTVVGQKLALSTYKDPDLPVEAKLRRALAILQNVEDLARTVDQETLGLAGAINKRLWEYNGRERDLETACAFYQRGFEQGVERDFGYTGINAAFVLDLLEDLEIPEQQDGTADTATARQEKARQIRQTIADQLPGLMDRPGNSSLPEKWWFLVTVGEALFGLHRFDQAGQWLQRAAALPNVPDWERETTARQLAALMSLMERKATRQDASLDPRAKAVLRAFLGNAEAALLSVVRGKIGLALSGGGFRASLYHIGVLARLAELDLLRHVEYLSCVSGGSIVGAHYYLEVRKLLTAKKDAEVTRQDYVDIVERLCTEFLAGVQRNIRVRIAAEWTTNVKMIFAPNYSRTKRAGELYEKELFARVQDGEGDRPRWLDELKINPRGEIPNFEPKDHNWRRAAKVPILILNATTLNTGHSWQFTATWMGESPAAINPEVDANYRLRRVYYNEAPHPHNKMRLGYAVAASACVPGIFEPLAIADLYERLPPDSDRKIRPIVRLVDGGVHDNQGTAALLEQGCTVLLVSDASGQMDHLDFPSDGLLGVPLRANSILQTRVRVSQYDDLASRLRGGTLKGVMFVHLKKDLDVQSIDWIGSQDRSDPLPPRELTSYGIQKGVQRRLAAIRTDLDSFSDIEAAALMTSGYLATETILQQPALGFPLQPSSRSSWWFLRIEPLLRQPSALSPVTYWIERQLAVGGKLAFKVWLSMRYLQFVAALVLVSAIGVTIAGASYLYEYAERQFSLSLTGTYGEIFWIIVVLPLLLCGFWLIAKLINRKTLHEILIGSVMASVGFVLARLHLHVFDPLFLRQARLSTVIGNTQSTAVQERIRGAEERQQSLEVATETERKSGYAVQLSDGFLLSAKKGLDPATETKVTQAMFGLSDDPNIPGARLDPETNLRLLRVPGTPWQIAYDVDEARQRVRIHHLARDDGAGSTRS
jgi:predicted acylesterase/phospholipase RssA